MSQLSSKSLYVILLTVVCVANQIVGEKVVLQDRGSCDVLYSCRIVTPIQSDQHLVLRGQDFGEVAQEVGRFIPREVAWPCVSFHATCRNRRSSLALC